MAHEVVWGRFEELEAFCVNNALAFSGWPGVERRHVTPFNPAIGVQNRSCLSAAASPVIIAHLDAADFAVPALIIA